MPLSPQTVARFEELTAEYLEPERILRDAEHFDLSWEEEPEGRDPQAYAADMVRRALLRVDFGQNRAWLAVLLDRIEARNSAAVATTDWQAGKHHEQLQGWIPEVGAEIAEGRQEEIHVEAGQEFSAPSEVRELFAEADDQLLVVDPYIDPSTLDCFRAVGVPIRLLTGTRGNSIQGAFDEALGAFRDEGFEIEVRRHPGLHDRHAVFNDQCYLIGSSLKDAGRKSFNCIPIRDAASSVIGALEQYWTEAAEYDLTNRSRLHSSIQATMDPVLVDSIQD